jgi:hypothetical protein
MVKAK